ncbi:MAG: AAA family ATPase [Pirellulaceae bacterium]|nr:AAA family ATPase [Pirellulaceae bacterium]
MYESYWQLQAKPFEPAADSTYYYPGQTQQGAMLKLRYALENHRGAAVLCGAAGLGKTLVARLLLKQLPARFAPRVHVVFPQMPADQLLAYLACELSQSAPAHGTEHNILRIRDTLREAHDAGQHAVLVLDEAHLIHDPRALETLRLLLNFEFDGQSALTLLLVGHPPLLTTLERIPEFDERIAVKCLLKRFRLEESVSYVHHRLQAAGARQTIFENDALEAIHRLAYGIPRRINRLCDLALLVGFAEERTVIDAAQIAAVAEDLVAVSADA